MKVFMLKCSILVAFMFISVLAGMQMANDGIHKMKGYSNTSFQNAVSIDQQDNQAVGSHDLLAKKKKLEEINTFNLFSSMGRKMSEGITQASEKTIQKILK